MMRQGCAIEYRRGKQLDKTLLRSSFVVFVNALPIFLPNRQDFRLAPARIFKSLKSNPPVLLSSEGENKMANHERCTRCRMQNRAKLQHCQFCGQDLEIKPKPGPTQPVGPSGTSGTVPQDEQQRRLLELLGVAPGGGSSSSVPSGQEQQQPPQGSSGGGVAADQGKKEGEKGEEEVKPTPVAVRVAKTALARLPGESLDDLRKREKAAGLWEEPKYENTPTKFCYPWGCKPIGSFLRGETRKKKFSMKYRGTCAFMITPNFPCGEEHPTEDHELLDNNFYETWTDMFEFGAFCGNCNKTGHTTEQCGLGWWRDHTCNPPLPAHLMKNSYPWSRGAAKQPLKIGYYIAIKPLPKGYPPRPAEYPNGLKGGLLDTFYGLVYSLENAVAVSQGKPPVKFDARRHKGFRLPDAVEETETTTKPAGDGFGGLDHSSGLTNPEWEEGKVTPFNGGIRKDLDKCLCGAHKGEVGALLAQSDREYAQFDKSGGNATLKTSCQKVNEKIWTIYKLYIPHWTANPVWYPSADLCEKLEEMGYEHEGGMVQEKMVPDRVQATRYDGPTLTKTEKTSSFADSEDDGDMGVDLMAPPKTSADVLFHLKVWVEIMEEQVGDQEKVNKFDDFLLAENKEVKKLAEKFVAGQTRQSCLDFVKLVEKVNQGLVTGSQGIARLQTALDAAKKLVKRKDPTVTEFAHLDEQIHRAFEVVNEAIDTGIRSFFGGSTPYVRAIEGGKGFFVDEKEVDRVWHHLCGAALPAKSDKVNLMKVIAWPTAFLDGK